MAGPESTTLRIDLRAALPILALVLVVFVIIFVELCGKTDVEPLDSEGTPIAAGPSATAGPTETPGPSPTAEPDAPTVTQENPAAGADRDEIRVRDLQTISDAMETYRAENGEYPSTGGGIQTVCTFEDDDKGCDLKEVLDPIPSDPLGNPGENGYWLESTEDTFTLYAQRESDLIEPCPEKPAHLEDFRTVFCVSNQ